MGLRTAEQYKSSLRDGRAVFFRGEKVADVTTHPVIGIAVEHAALDYRMAHDPKYRELAVVKEGADEYSRYYHVPQNGDDLLKRSALIAASTREGATLVVLIKEIGTDALLALRIIGERLAAAGKPEYRERINKYYRELPRQRSRGRRRADRRQGRSRARAHAAGPSRLLRANRRGAPRRYRRARREGPHQRLDQY